MHITAWHNIATDGRGRLEGFGDGYEPHHTLVPVATWEVDCGQDHLAVCEAAFELLNIGDDPAFGIPDARAVQYRRRRNRSLSVGDVISITETLPGRDRSTAWYSCAPAGWNQLQQPPASFAITANRPGTTSLDADQIAASL